MTDFTLLYGVERHYCIIKFIKRKEYNFLLKRFMENLHVHYGDNTKCALAPGQ